MENIKIRKGVTILLLGRGSKCTVTWINLARFSLC